MWSGLDLERAGSPISLGNKGQSGVVVEGGFGFGDAFGGGGFEVAAVVDLLDDGKVAWELDEVDIAEGKFEEDPADGSAVENADLLPCCVNHAAGKLRLGGNSSESPESVIDGVTLGIGGRGYWERGRGDRETEDRRQESGVRRP
jgi:hypothetical protein